ncbi:MAG: serine hydrolase [Prolixibacteraceae bacterium]|jgi:CubicO group peptidase (beta-lactamase class C family)
MKKRTFNILILMMLLSISQGTFAYAGNDKNVDPRSQPVDTIFAQKLGNALNYIEGVCGENGIKRVVILKDDKVVFKGTESEVTQRVWSCTKSFVSTVLGLLISEGKCLLDDKVCNYLPELNEYYPDVTFRNFTTMTSGYKAIGDDETVGHGQSRTPFRPSGDRLFAPGTEFRYWDSAMNTFALALTKVAGESLKTYFTKKVADKIGMDPEKWDWQDFGEIDGLLVASGAGNRGGIFISASEMARFGLLFLNRGVWDGQQIIPQPWIAEATSAQVKNIIPNNETPYGFNWWTAGTFPDAPKGTFAAQGHNNNNCIVVPEWNLVVTRLGLDGNIDDEKWNKFLQIIGEAFQ